jgi:RimJ/RimL family protein N-acetyltransferase
VTEPTGHPEAPHYVAHHFDGITTARLHLRVMTPDDVDDVHSYMSDPKVCRYLLFEPRSRGTVARKIAEWSTMGRLADVGDDLELALDLLPAQTEARRVIGHLYFKLKSVDDLAAEIGWTLHPDFEGQGFATEAAESMLAYAFTELGLHRVIAELDPRNETSIALCRRLGMREEALFRDDLWLKGEWSDTGIWAILEEEWMARHRV